VVETIEAIVVQDASDLRGGSSNNFYALASTEGSHSMASLDFSEKSNSLHNVGLADIQRNHLSGHGGSSGGNDEDIYDDVTASFPYRVTTWNDLEYTTWDRPAEFMDVDIASKWEAFCPKLHQ